MKGCKVRRKVAILEQSFQGQGKGFLAFQVRVTQRQLVAQRATQGPDSHGKIKEKKKKRKEKKRKEKKVKKMKKKERKLKEILT